MLMVNEIKCNPAVNVLKLGEVGMMQLQKVTSLLPNAAFTEDSLEHHPQAP